MSHGQEWITQTVACRSRTLPPDFACLPRCSACISKTSRRDSCRFSGFRRILKSTVSGVVETSFEALEGPDPIFSRVYNRKMTRNVLESTKTICATFLLPLLSKEHARSSELRSAYRKRELRCRVTCDRCSTDLFTGAWLCSTCGQEFCDLCTGEIQVSACPSDTGILHTQPNLLPSFRISKDQLANVVDSMISYASKLNPSEEESPKDVPVLQYGKLGLPAFRMLWRRGGPISVTGIHRQLQGGWSPADFIANHSRCSVELIDCTSGTAQRSSVGAFFQMMMVPGPHKRVMKLKDWPPQKHFSAEFPTLFQAFSEIVPFPDLTRLNGLLNLASHFPSNGIAPDLGPKMYVALGFGADNDAFGTTKLHMDVTDAVNLLVWSSGDRADIAAIWDIFPVQAVGPLRQFLRKHEFYQGPSDPIHSQTVFLSDESLTRFSVEYNIRPWRIFQRTGDTIFIPAGCAHQVRNVTNAIKIACDFLSPENLHRTQRLVCELRHHRLTTQGDDVLQLHSLLWYAWHAATTADCIEEVDETMDCASSLGPYAIMQDAPQGNEATRHIHDVPNDGEPSGSLLSIRGTQTFAKHEQRKAKVRIHRIAKAYGPRPDRHEHTYACPHPVCKGMFNRGGLLDHLRHWHDDFYGVNSELEKRLRKERKVDVAQFWRALEQTYKKPPALGRILIE